MSGDARAGADEDEDEDADEDADADEDEDGPRDEGRFWREAEKARRG